MAFTPKLHSRLLLPEAAEAVDLIDGQSQKDNGLADIEPHDASIGALVGVSRLPFPRPHVALLILHQCDCIGELCHLVLEGGNVLLLGQILVQLISHVHGEDDRLLGQGGHAVGEAQAIEARGLSNYGKMSLLLPLDGIVGLTLGTKDLQAEEGRE